MSGWVRPEGPESIATYWSRRLVVIAAAVVVLVLGIMLVTTAAQGSEPGAAQPASAVTTAAPASAVAPIPSAASSSASVSSSASAGTSLSASTSTSPSASTSTSPNASTRTDPATPATPVTPACDPARLRTTLQGDPSPKVGHRVVFSLSVINGNGQRCVLKRNAALAELKIYSGADRIWSTDDCISLVPTTRNVLEPEQAVAWKLAWNGARSAPRCKVAPATPRAGTYFATFQLAGAKPVQQRMVLTAP